MGRRISEKVRKPATNHFLNLKSTCMKRENFSKGAPLRSFILLTICTLIVGCQEPKPEPEVPIEVGIYVLNEGNFGFNNSSISYYDVNKNQTVNDIFLAANQRGLGDVGNDMKLHNGLIYCIINVSERLEAIDVKTCKSLKQLSLTGKQPRCVAFNGTKGYVTCFNGELLQIDLQSFIIEKTINVGKNPEGICIANNKIYVANSGGLDFPCTENTVSVLNLNTLEIVKTITTEVGPYQLKTDKNKQIWVSTRGNYMDLPMNFQCIDTERDSVVFTLNLPVMGFDILNNDIYIYNYEYSNSSSWIKILNASSKTVTNQQFIKDGTLIKVPYGIFVDPESNDVYITDAINYTTQGDVYCFSKEGKKKFQFEAGYCPTGNMVVVRE